MPNPILRLPELYEAVLYSKIGFPQRKPCVSQRKPCHSQCKPFRPEGVCGGELDFVVTLKPPNTPLNVVLQVLEVVAALVLPGGMTPLLMKHLFGT